MTQARAAVLQPSQTVAEYHHCQFVQHMLFMLTEAHASNAARPHFEIAGFAAAFMRFICTVGAVLVKLGEE